MPIECNCGGKYQRENKSTHEKTNLHQNWLNKISLGLAQSNKVDRIDCMCGNQYRHSDRFAHFESILHQEWLKQEQTI